MLVSRPTSASTHSFIMASLVAPSLRSSGRLCQILTTSPMGPEPLGLMAPPIETRSFMSVVSETRQPSPGLPRRSTSGTRVSVKYTSLNSASPVI